MWLERAYCLSDLFYLAHSLRLTKGKGVPYPTKACHRFVDGGSTRTPRQGAADRYSLDM